MPLLTAAPRKFLTVQLSPSFVIVDWL